MISLIQNTVRGADAVLARMYLSCFREKDSLITFLFHSLFEDDREIARNLVDPLQRTTVAKFRHLVSYYQQHGYQFIKPSDLLHGLNPGAKYAMLTFDDGYHNNTRALQVLEEFQVPAAFFVSTEHVLRNKCFWWDVHFRERIAQGIAPSRVYREGIAMKSKRTEEIEAELIARHGKDAFTPRGDTDRPFRPDELREFARNRFVHIGNHTANHAILTNYTPDQVEGQLGVAQNALRDITGAAPEAIAYPNGAYSGAVLQACGHAGLKVGFTIRPEKHALPIGEQTPDLLRIGRFAPHGEGPIDSQCQTFRSDLLLYGVFREAYLRIFRGLVAQ